MVNVNEYFQGKVKSLSFSTKESKATVGIMEAGEYQFNTDGPEIMTVIRGTLTVKLPGSSDWATFNATQSFKVPGKSRFELKVPHETAYLCEFR